MKLTFLGNSYEANSTQIPVVEGQIVGKYRGQTWRKKNLQKGLVSNTLHYLQYRGVKYIGFVYSWRSDRAVKLAPELVDSNIFREDNR